MKSMRKGSEYLGAIPSTDTVDVSMKSTLGPVRRTRHRHCRGSSELDPPRRLGSTEHPLVAESTTNDRAGHSSATDEHDLLAQTYTGHRRHHSRRHRHVSSTPLIEHARSFATATAVTPSIELSPSFPILAARQDDQDPLAQTTVAGGGRRYGRPQTMKVSKRDAPNFGDLAPTSNALERTTSHVSAQGGASGAATREIRKLTRKHTRPARGRDAPVQDALSSDNLDSFL